MLQLQQPLNRVPERLIFWLGWRIFRLFLLLHYSIHNWQEKVTKPPSPSWYYHHHAWQSVQSSHLMKHFPRHCLVIVSSLSGCLVFQLWSKDFLFFFVGTFSINPDVDRNTPSPSSSMLWQALILATFFFTRADRLGQISEIGTKLCVLQQYNDPTLRFECIKQTNVFENLWTILKSQKGDRHQETSQFWLINMWPELRQTLVDCHKMCIVQVKTINVQI